MTNKDEIQELLDSRVALYGDKKINMDSSAQMVEAYMAGLQQNDRQLEGYDFAMIMVLYKIYRFAVSPTYGDNLDDIEGYLKIARECLGKDIVNARTPDEFETKRNQRLMAQEMGQSKPEDPRKKYENPYAFVEEEDEV